MIGKCDYVKREGESCTLNNNCRYPDCTKPEPEWHVPLTRGNVFNGLTDEDFKMADNAIKKMKDADTRK